MEACLHIEMQQTMQKGCRLKFIYCLTHTKTYYLSSRLNIENCGIFSGSLPCRIQWNIGKGLWDTRWSPSKAFDLYKLSFIAGSEYENWNCPTSVISNLKTSIQGFVHWIMSPTDVWTVFQWWHSLLHYVTVYFLLSFQRHESTQWSRGPSLSRFNDHTLLDTPHLLGLLWTSDRPVAETSTWHNTTHKTQTSIPPARFEPAIPANERPPTNALDCAATGITSSLISYSKKT